MARSIRVQYQARGNRREAIFLDDVDREFFLQTLGEACAMTGWRVHAWVLMGNHYHLLIETPEANLEVAELGRRAKLDYFNSAVLRAWRAAFGWNTRV
ncbi:MAG TPA: transposase [Chthoniobacterales bacterium]